MQDPQDFQPEIVPPVASVAPDYQPNSPGLIFLPQGRRIENGSGTEWLSHSYYVLFKRAPIGWILAALVMHALIICIALVPLIGSIASVMLKPVFLGGMLLGCAAAERGEPMNLHYLFEGFQRHTEKLVILGLLTLIATLALSICIGVLILIMAGIGILIGVFGGTGSDGVRVMLIVGACMGGLLIVCLLVYASVILSMAISLAPALIIFHDMSPSAAFSAGITASRKNFWMVLTFSLVMGMLYLLGALPLLLGWLLLMPLSITASYAAYREIFFVRADHTSAHGAFMHGLRWRAGYCTSAYAIAMQAGNAM